VLQAATPAASENENAVNEGIDLREVLDSIFAFVAILSPDGVLLEVAIPIAKRCRKSERRE
jgi:hypothetical protein